MKHTIILPLYIVFIAAGSAHAAQLVVVDARGIGFSPGTILDSEKPLTLKQGQHVTLVSDTGATIKLDGPYNRAPTSGAAGGVDLTQTISALVTQRQARLTEYGTTRGAAPSKLPDPWLIDVSHSATACVPEKATPVLWRPEAITTSLMTIMPGDRSWKAQINWSAGQDRLVVPAEVPMHAGATYIVVYNNVESAIAITQIPLSLANDSMRAGWMAEKGCEAQAEALLSPKK